MFVITVSRRGNKYAQVCATDFGWARAFPMTFRSDAHETFLLLFAKDGVLPACICNNAKDMIHGKFNQKLKDAACHLKQLESCCYSLEHQSTQCLLSKELKVVWLQKKNSQNFHQTVNIIASKMHGQIRGQWLNGFRHRKMLFHFLCWIPTSATWWHWWWRQSDHLV